MLKRNLDLIKDTETREAVRFVLEEGLGNAIILSAAPTAGTPLLADNEIGIYSGVIYIRKVNTIYVVTPSSTIVIT